MKKIRMYIFLFFTLINSVLSFSQNLVPNFSFEEKRKCPRGVDAIKLSKQWYSPTKATPDYFNKCCFSNYGKSVSIPKNFFGIQKAYQGNSYAGIGFHFVKSEINGSIEKDEYREYIQTKLLKPLLKNQTYKVSFFISLSDYSAYKTDKIQVNFSQKKCKSKTKGILKGANNYIDCIPKEEINKEKWIELVGIYTAGGEERYITIGFFDHHFDFIAMPQQKGKNNLEAYYYIDNVSVIRVDKHQIRENEIDQPQASQIEDVKIKRNEISNLPQKMGKKKIEDSKPTLDKVMVNEKIVFNDIRFHTGESKLLKISYDVLDTLLTALKKNPKIELEIIGHTDNIGKLEANLELSVARAKTIYSYFIAKGISVERLSYKGMGASVPIDSNKTAKGRAKNRRVEFKILRK